MSRPRSPRSTAQRSERVDTITIEDPDGDTIAFAAAKDPSLAR